MIDIQDFAKKLEERILSISVLEENFWTKKDSLVDFIVSSIEDKRRVKDSFIIFVENEYILELKENLKNFENKLMIPNEIK